jgi:hypothetical protein
MILPGGAQGQPLRVLAPLVLPQGQGDRVEESCGAPRAGRLGLAERRMSPQRDDGLADVQQAALQVDVLPA